MTLKVFTPAQARSMGEQRIARDSMRATSLAETTKELLDMKKEVEKSFDDEMKRQRETTEKWFEETSLRKNELLKEVEKLEDRRKKALLPPMIAAEDIHSTEEALWARKLELDSRSSEVEEESRFLMAKLDANSSKEQDLDEREKRMKVMELGVETQRNQISQELKQFNIKLVEFNNKIEEKEKEFAYRDSELDARKNLYDENDRSLIAREKEMESAHRLLADQRLLLSKGFEELRSKTHGKHN